MQEKRHTHGEMSLTFLNKSHFSLFQWQNLFFFARFRLADSLLKCLRRSSALSPIGHNLEPVFKYQLQQLIARWRYCGNVLEKKMVFVVYISMGRGTRKLYCVHLCGCARGKSAPFLRNKIPAMRKDTLHDYSLDPTGISEFRKFYFCSFHFFCSLWLWCCDQPFPPESALCGAVSWEIFLQESRDSKTK